MTGEASMPTVPKAFVLVFLIFLFFCLMSRIDFVINGMLYNYGLRFSYEWALGYWITYVLAFVVFSITISFTYWYSSNKTAKDLRFSIALFVTINALVVGGLQDIMFYVFWAGGLPPNNVVWWWTPWAYILGTWTSLHQIGFAALMICGILFSWILAVKKK